MSCFCEPPPPAGCRIATSHDVVAGQIAKMKANGVKIYGSHGCGYCRKILAEHPDMATLFVTCGDNGKECKSSDKQPVHAYPTIDFQDGHVVKGYKPFQELQAAFANHANLMTRPRSPTRLAPPRPPRERTVQSMLEHGVKFFGTPGCHYCKMQKAEHPDLDRMYVDCSGGAPCITSSGKNVRALPTWDFGRDRVYEGFKKLDELLDLHTAK